MQHRHPQDQNAPLAMVTGATGYVGGQLVNALTDHGWRVTALVRSVSKSKRAPWAHKMVSADAPADLPAGKVRIVQGDANNPEDVVKALDGADAAYYLLHSMGSGADFEERELQSARSFASAIDQAGTPRVVFLGGLHPDGELSPHLRSRKQVGEVLMASSATTICLQAGVVIGSGSASYVMLRHLSERLPGVIAPRWIRNTITPISLRNLLYFLEQAALVDVPGSRTFDIGGPEDVSYIDMMQRYARHFRLGPRPAITAPVTTPTLGSHWVGLVTPVTTEMAKPLVGSLLHDTVVKERDFERLAGEPPEGLDTLEHAFKATAPAIDPYRWLRVLGASSVASLAVAGLEAWGVDKRRRSTPPAAATLANAAVWATTNALTIGDLGDDAAGSDHPAERKRFTIVVGAHLASRAALALTKRSTRKTRLALGGVSLLSAAYLSKLHAQHDVARGVISGGCSAVWAATELVGNGSGEGFGE